MMEEPHKENRLLTLLLEILFGIIAAISVLLYAAYGPFFWMPQRKWITFAILSLAIFGVPLWWYRDYWNRSSFWFAFVALLLLHVIAYSTFLARVKEFPPLLHPLALVFESLAIFPLLAKAARTGSHNSRG